MTLQNNTQTYLKPALALRGCSAEFPQQPGKFVCKIQVDQGEVLFCHGAYNVETGCWDDAPDAGEDNRVLVHAGECKELEFTCGNHYGQSDDVWIYNNSYLKPARFTCDYKKVS